METIRVRSRSNEEGILHLDVPVGIKDTDLEITLTIAPARQGKGYPPGFFEQTYGCCQDDPLSLDRDRLID